MTPFDPSRVDLLLQYALLVAGEEDEYIDRQLGPIHLIKYVYLADLAYARHNEGKTFTGIDWQWIVSRYNNGSEARPAEPALYLLRLEPDGSLRARVDCNRAGGRYRLGKHCKIGLI